MSSCVTWELSRLGIYGLWRDRFKDLFPTLFLMSLGSSPSFFLRPNVEETQANDRCRPPDHSYFLVLGAIKGVCAGEKRGDAGGHHFYSIWLILCSYEGWLRRRPAMFCIRMCLEIQKRGVAFTACRPQKKWLWFLLRQQRSFKNNVQRERCWAWRSLGLHGPPEDTCLSQRKGLLAIPFSVWGTTLRFPLCGQWKERGLWFLGIVSTGEKVLKILPVFGKTLENGKGRESLVYPQISWVQLYLQFVSVHFDSLMIYWYLL